MKAVLVAGGTVSEFERLKEFIKTGDAVICADSGYDYVIGLDIIPDIVIGDMDSVRSTDIKARKIIYPKRKDFTDSELVMEYAVKNGYDELVLFGFTGSRMDHTLANISMLCRYSDKNAVMIDKNNEIRAAKGENIIEGKKGDIVSIIPAGGNLCGVTTENLEYPLKNETLYFGEGRGVSNVMTKDSCIIRTKSGSGLIIKSTD